MANKPTPTPKARRVVAPPSSKADLLERFKDYPGIKAWDRAYDSPEGPGSLPILLSDEPTDACLDSGHQNVVRPGAVRCHLCSKPVRTWFVRQINTKQQGRVAHIRKLGYVPVQFAELASPDEIADLSASSTDGLVHTGINGSRVLYKIPLELYNARKRREREQRDRRSKSVKRVREDLANDAAAAQGFGSEAADAIHEGLEFSSRKVRTTLEEEHAGIGVDD